MPLGHIQENSSKHSECIVTENGERAALFTRIVDAACVYTNVSTAFTDRGTIRIEEPKSESARKSYTHAVRWDWRKSLLTNGSLKEMDKREEIEKLRIKN